MGKIFTAMPGDQVEVGQRLEALPEASGNFLMRTDFLDLESESVSPHREFLSHCEKNPKELTENEENGAAKTQVLSFSYFSKAIGIPVALLINITLKEKAMTTISMNPGTTFIMTSQQDCSLVEIRKQVKGHVKNLANTIIKKSAIISGYIVMIPFCAVLAGLMGVAMIFQLRTS